MAERLLILNDLGQGLLNRAYQVVQFDGIKMIEPELDRFFKVRSFISLDVFVLSVPGWCSLRCAPLNQFSNLVLELKEAPP